jgi:hypothetical protein
VWLIFLERSEPVAVQVSERAEPADTISTPTARSPRAHYEEAASGDAGRPLTAVETTTAAPQKAPPRAPARTHGDRPGGAGTPASDLSGVTVTGENRQTPEKRQSPIDRSEPRTEPRRPGQDSGDVTATRAADATTPPALGTPSTIIPYNGVMTDASGAPVVGFVSTILALYEEPSGEAPLWVEIKTMRTDPTGGYAVLLGGTTEFPVDLFATGETRWLGVQPNGGAEPPRVRFTGEAERPTTRDTGPLDGPPRSALVRLGREDGAGDTAVTWGAEDTSLPALNLPPLMITYRGVMADASGVPLVGRVSAIFALYEAPSGGVPVWVDIKTVRTDATGGYVVLLGGTTEFPMNLFATGETRWLGVQPDGEAETSRVRFAGGPETEPARDAVPPNGRPPSTLVRLGGEAGTGDAAATEEATSPTRTTLGEPPPLIPYRGVITKASGAPVGPISTIFALYEAPSGGVPMWVDIKTVHAGAAGGFVVLLGGTTEFPVDLFVTDEARWLGVQPNGEPEQPRVGFTRMPCTLAATDTDPGGRRSLSAVRLGGEHTAMDEAARHGQPQRRGSQPSICGQR